MSNSYLSSTEIHLALSPYDLTDDYNRHAGVTLLSFLENCDNNTHVTVHLLYDESIPPKVHDKKYNMEYNISCYCKIAEMYNCTLLFHPLVIPDWINTIPRVKKWTPGTLLRLYLPNLLKEVDKVIYLDCDMVVTTDMLRLWKTPVDDYYLAAVPDSASVNFSRKRKRYCRKKNIPFETYFCAGTLILNLKKIREDVPSFECTLFKYLRENPDLPYLDQDLLNWFCHGNYVPLDEKYNIYADRRDSLSFVDDAIIHYAAKAKPWKRYGGRIDDPYWKYLMQVPWAEEREELVRYVRKAPDVSGSFTVVTEYYYSQDGLPYHYIAIKMLKLSIRILLEIIKGTLSYIAVRFNRMGLL